VVLNLLRHLNMNERHLLTFKHPDRIQGKRENSNLTLIPTPNSQIYSPR
jgi:hypothetical protein